MWTVKQIHGLLGRAAACAALSAVSAVYAGAKKAEDLVSNPGFENVTGNGWLSGWADKRPVFSVSTRAPHGGTHCLRYENHDPAKYVLCSTPVKLTPGRQYDFSVWVRTEAVKGAGKGATICVQWWKKDDSFIGGSYPAGIKGTSKGWQLVHGRTGTIPKNAARMDVTLYLRQGCTGVAYWDDVVLREYQPPLMTLLLTDCYRDQTDGGPVRVSAAINLPSNGLTPKDVTCELRVLNARKEPVLVLSPTRMNDEQAEFRFDAGKLAPGDYSLACTIAAKKGGATGSATGRLQRVAAFPKRKAYIDRYQRLILDGKPFFPLGTYWAGVSRAQLDIYAKSDFNCLMPYARISRQALDMAQKRGIKVIYSVKDLYAGRSGLKTEKQARAKIRSVVDSLKDNPAIMAWYINDEMPLSKLAELTAHRDLMEKLDPGRPTWVVLCEIGQIRSYIPSFDVIGTDPYPIPSRPASTVLDYTQRTVQASFGYRPVWMVPQIFDWAAYKKTPKAKKRCRPPTLQEMRSMAWQAIAGGANGLIFYSWFDLWRMDKTVKQGGRALVREPFDQRWQDVKTMAAEIARHIPILLSVAPHLSLTHVAAPEAVAWRLYGYEGKTVLVAVNSGTKPVEAAFTFDGGLQEASASLGPPAPEPAGRVLRLAFKPLEPRVIEITPTTGRNGRENR